MPVTDLDSAIEDLYSIAVNPTHAYHSDSQTALFLLSTLADVIQSLKDFDIPNATAYKLPISYILFDSAIEIVFKPHQTMIIIQFLRKAIETELDPSEESQFSPAESAMLERATIIIPWLWRASHHGIQTDFAQNATSLWLLFQYRSVVNLDSDHLPADDDVLKVLETNHSGIEILESLFGIAFEMKGISSFARLLSLLLRLLALMEGGSRANHLSRFRVTVIESFLLSWNVPSGLRMECWNTFFWYLTSSSHDVLRCAIARISLDASYLTVMQFVSSAAETLRTIHASHDNPYREIENHMEQTLCAIQLLWTIAFLDERVHTLIQDQIWMISSLSHFLNSDFIKSSKEVGWRNYLLSSAISGTSLRFIALLLDKKIKVPLFGNVDEVTDIIERMLFLSPPDLPMSCDGIFAFIIATKTIWQKEKEAGSISWLIVNALHGLILEDKPCLKKLLPIMNQVLSTALEGPLTTTSPPLAGVAHVQKHFVYILHGIARFASSFSREDILRLLHQFLSPCRDLPENQTWAIRYIRDQAETLQTRFIQHCDCQEWSVATLLLDILRISMKSESDAEKLKELERRLQTEAYDFPEGTDRRFFLIRPYAGVMGIMSL